MKDKVFLENLQNANDEEKKWWDKNGARIAMKVKAWDRRSEYAFGRWLNKVFSYYINTNKPIGRLITWLT